MTSRSILWPRHVFLLVIIACGLFIPLTIAAMAFYPTGGTSNPSFAGYAFLHNTLNDLGRTETPAGEANVVAAALFSAAMAAAGGAMVVFFVAFAQFFDRSPLDWIVSGLGSLGGVIAGMCFIGLGYAPIDLFESAHLRLMLLGLRALSISAILYVVAILRDRHYPHRFAGAFALCAVFLLAYDLLLPQGPAAYTTPAASVHVLVHNILIYLVVASIGLQAYAAYTMDSRPPQ